MVIPEGAALDTAQLPVVAPPDEPPVATPDEPLVATPDEPPPLLPEDDIAPVDDPPLDGLPVATLEPVDGAMDPDVEPVPLLVAPLVVPLLPNDGSAGPLIASPWCSWTPQHAASSEMAKHCPTATYLENVELRLTLRRLSGRLTMRFGMLPPRKTADGAYPFPFSRHKTSSRKVTKKLTQVYAGNGQYAREWQSEN
jgi:hypothetical protein